MEKRIVNVIIQAPGGTAAKNSNTYKLSLPSSWVKEMGISEDDRQVEIKFDGTSITITKKLAMQEFIHRAKKRGQKILVLSYYDDNTLCTKIAADYNEKSICVENYVTNVLRTAFGNHQQPTWEDYMLFLEERCIPRSRAGLRDYLDEIGVDAFDPLEIIKKTSGRMAEDQQWIKVVELK
jgi:hypothetical protein